MKPRTKLDKLVVEEAKTLRKITDEEVIRESKRTPNNYCYNNYYDIVCIQTKTVIHKRIKGEKWKDAYYCPVCKKNHDFLKHYESVYTFQAKFGFYDYTENFQVFRGFLVYQHVYRSRPTIYCAIEVMQKFYSPKGKLKSISKIPMGWSGNYSRDLELRRSNYAFSGTTALVGNRFHPLWRRNGLNSKSVLNFSHSYLDDLMTNNRFESLFKMGQYQLAKYYLTENQRVDPFWSIIKRVSKHGYKIKDPSLYIDYLHMLENIKYNPADINVIAPLNIKKAHNKAILSVSTRTLTEKVRIAVEKHEKMYQKRMDPVADIVLKKKNISIVPLTSIREIYLEGETMSHCVFKSGYYKNSMIWSARVNEERIETLQINPKTLEVDQCRGWKNEDTKYHDRILELWSTIHEKNGKRKEEQGV